MVLEALWYRVVPGRMKFKGEVMDWTRHSRTYVFAIACLVTGLLLGSAYELTQQSASSAARESTSSGERNRNIFHDESDPLGVGAPIPAAVAVAPLTGCTACPVFPSGTRADLALVSEAWFRPADRAIALDYRNGVRVYLFVDPRDDDEWAKSAVASDGQDLSGELGLALTSVNGMAAVSLAADASGPASLSWIQGGYMVEILGRGGQTINDLQTMAGVIASASSTPSPSASV